MSNKNGIAELTWIDYQKGKLGYRLNEDGMAVLCDYIGDDTILVLPSDLGDGYNWIEVSTYIPDESFKSCKNIKLIIADCRFDKWTLGYFVFQNCLGLQAIAELTSYYNDDDGFFQRKNEGSTDFDEFSFVEKDFTPKKIKQLAMALNNDDCKKDFFENFTKAICKHEFEEQLIKVINYDSYYTGMLLDDYEDEKLQKNALQHGCDVSALITVGNCWKKVKLHYINNTFDEE